MKTLVLVLAVLASFAAPAAAAIFVSSDTPSTRCTTTCSADGTTCTTRCY